MAMLKVVGASGLQTRLTLVILVAVTSVGLVTFFYSEHLPNTHDGNYAATVYWSSTTGYRLQFWGQNNEPSSVRAGVARAYYRPDMTADGWASMEIETAAAYPDAVQAHAAGLVEGSLSWQLIYFHWKNTVERACADRQRFCERVRTVLQRNTVHVRQTARARDRDDPFWHQVNMFYEQLDGLVVGWKYGVARSRKDVQIPPEDFLWMNTACDIRDLELMFNASLESDPGRPSLGVALLKLIPDDSDPTRFLLAHTTSSLYSAMLRVQKRYNFGLHETGASGMPLVRGREISFTSYPGAIHSQDDFYRVDDRLTVSGTALKNLNQSAWSDDDVAQQALMGPRVMAANRLAADGRQWAATAGRSHSGTGNKQWLVAQPRPADRALELWVVEQMPGLTVARPQTDALAAAGYWAADGLPFYRETMAVSDSARVSHATAGSVSRTLSDGQRGVTDLDSLLGLMRGTDMTIAGRRDLSIDRANAASEYERRVVATTDMSNEIPHGSDSDSESDSPRFSADEADRASAALEGQRLDAELQQIEGNELPIDADDDVDDGCHSQLPEVDSIVNKRKALVIDSGASAPLPLREFSGVIDLKVSGNDGWVAAAGPPFVAGSAIVGPFQWSRSALHDLPHVGQADVWDFTPVRPKWVWH